MGHMKKTMKAPITYPDQFSTETTKSADDIRRICEQIERSGTRDYIVKHNGNHIWLEVGQTQQEVWSPLLHVELSAHGNHTVVKGQYVENPGLWVFLLVARSIALLLFGSSVFFLYQKIASSEPAGRELLFLFTSVSLWFGLALLAQWNRRISYKQAARLRDLIDDIVA